MDPTIQALVAIGSALIGLPALMAVVINILKTLDIVKDDDAQKWSFVLNGAGIYALYAWKVFDPTANLQVADETMKIVASAIGVFAQLFIALKVSPAFHKAIQGIPVIGKSYSKVYK